MFNLIGISGLARSGKDTYASYLKDYINSNNSLPEAVTYAFADPLKECASAMFGLPLSVFYGGNEREDINEFWGISPREMLQKLGTEGGREIFGYDLWTKRAEMEYKNNSDNIFIVTDIRFESETDFIRNNNGLVIHIINNNIKTVVRKHESENGVMCKREDLIVFNNKTLSDLKDSAKKVSDSIERYI